MNLIDLFQGQLSPEVLQQIGNQIGVQDTRQIAAASNGIASTLMAALNKNTANPSGLNALVSALDRDHDGGILDDLMGYVTGQRQPANASTDNGSGESEECAEK